ncbi:MAG: MarR family winged helix-turn-helix transcriptional regulator [Candidatus Dormibacteria bacterium]
MPALLNLVLNRLGREIFDHLAASGFPDARRGDGVVMHHLRQGQGVRLSQLAALAGVTPQSMGEVVDDLERRGHVERRSDPSDRRAKLIYMAPRGRAAMRTSWEAVQIQEAALAELLGQRDVRKLRLLLTRIVDAYQVSPRGGES